MLEHYTTMMQNPLGAVKDIAVSSAIATGPPMIAAFRQAANNNVGEGMISVKQESKLMEGVCANCGNSISDKYRLRVDERDYHESCLSCAECSMPLSHRCYSRDCKFYCRADYQRIYAAKCQRCQQRVDSNEMVMRLPDRSVFHVDCFVCYVCGELLMRGMPFIVRHGQPLCKREFPTADMYNMNNSPQDDELLDDTRPRDGRRGPKRPRTILTSVQRRQFKASFELSPKPCRKVREALAKDTGLSVRVVQVWFQNQRAKMKKLQRKAKTEPGSEKEPKEERKPESPHSDHSHYMNALNMRDGESSNFPSATQPLNPNNPYSPDDAYPGHSGESFCSSDISIDGTEAGFEIGESESGGPGGPDGSHGGSSHSHHGGSGPGGSGTAAGPGGGPNPEQMPSLAQAFHPAMHNPIDKLCMMQTSYFSSADHP